MPFQPLELGQPETPLALLKRIRATQRQLCDNLEAIANQLPDDVDLSVCRSAWDCLRLDLPLFHRDEEVFFELLGNEHPAVIDLGARCGTRNWRTRNQRSLCCRFGGMARRPMYRRATREC